MKKRYAFKDGVPHRVPASVAGAEIDKLIKKHGSARPSIVVEEARSAKHPLHAWFEWDNTKAAEAYRLDQAARLLSGLVILRDDKPDVELRAFVNVERNGEWRSFEAVVQEPESVAVLLQQALDDLRAFARRYAELKEIAGIRPTITKLADAVSKTNKRAA